VAKEWRLRVSARITPDGELNHEVSFQPFLAPTDDIECEFDGVKVIVSNGNVRRLRGSRIDYGTEGERRGFIVNNPNASNKELKQQLLFERQLMGFGLAYHTYAASHGHGPRRLQELEAEPDRFGFPLVSAQISDGKFIVAWGAVFRGTDVDNHKCWLGYQAQVPHEGGTVLRGDGWPEIMTADQFRQLKQLTVVGDDGKN
jgi:Fe-S cluster assembly iron-binding protein IscA